MGVEERLEYFLKNENLKILHAFTCKDVKGIRFLLIRTLKTRKLSILPRTTAGSVSSIDKPQDLIQSDTQALVIQ